jgi:hypothetical protein
VTVKVTLCDDSSAGPAEMAVAHALSDWAPLSSRTVWFGPAVKLGAMLTAGGGGGGEGGGGGGGGGDGGG